MSEARFHALTGGRPLELSDRERFSATVVRPPAVSDIVFGTLFGWQEYFRYHVSVRDGICCVYYMKDGVACVLPPVVQGIVGDPDYGERVLRLFEFFDECARGAGIAVRFRFMPDSLVSRLPGGCVHARPDRDHFDYVYRRSELADLPGSRLSAKRNLIKQFSAANRWRYQPLRLSDAPLCRSLIDMALLSVRTGDDMLGSAAYCMACRLLDQGGELGIIGGILRVDQRVVAIALGTVVERFEHPDGIFPTVIVHHEAALIEFKGVYQMINQQFCAHLPAHVVYVNREEDLGIPGLRKAKTSYQPAHLIVKNELTLAGGR